VVLCVVSLIRTISKCDENKDVRQREQVVLRNGQDMFFVSLETESLAVSLSQDNAFIDKD